MSLNDVLSISFVVRKAPNGGGGRPEGWEDIDRWENDGGRSAEDKSYHFDII